MFAFPNARILIFAKAPVPGACKSRLIPALGCEGAANLAGILLETTVERVAMARLAPAQLCCAPDTDHPLFQQLAERFAPVALRLEAQRGKDLGVRMQMAFEQALASADRAVLIGTDCPLLDAGYLEEALRALDKTPAVLGPADDGGYVLIGLRQAALSVLAQLFTEMPWGGDRVAALTRQRMGSIGLGCLELPSLPDLDRADDLQRCLDLGLLSGFGASPGFELVDRDKP